ncbi:MAG: hypothetical protein ACHQ2Z_09560 [Elusimicrobiota bacterium]
MIILYFAVFVSGFASLIYQVLWERSLSLLLGGEAYAVAAVVTAFMAGLALGGAASGALADRAKKPLAWAAALEVLIALCALALPHLWRLSAWSVCLLLLPTFCMGASWPLVCLAGFGRKASPGDRAAALYGVNTLGAASGCFAAGFFLIGALGMRRANDVGIGLSLAGAALFAWSARRRFDARVEIAPAPAGETHSPRVLTMVALFTALSGLAALGYEIVWFRALRFVIGSTAYSFCTMLTALLAGLGLGSLLIGWALRRRKRSALLWFAAAQAGLGISTFWSVRLFASTWTIAAFVLGFLGRWIAISPNSWAVARTMNFAVAFMVLLPPTLCLGCIFPLANELLVRDGRRPGRGIGAVYCLNTAGCALAPALVTFYLIPAAGINHSLLIFAFLNLAMGAALVFFGERNRPALAAMAAVAALSFWLLPEGFVRRANDPSLLYERDGVLATIRVFRRQGVKFLATDNFYVQGSDPTNPAIQPKRLGLLPYLLHPKERLDRVLQIGLGTGINLGALAKVPLNSVDAVEIVPELKEAARLFDAESGGVLGNPRVRFIAEDGRRFAATARGTYDLIVGDLFFPDHAGAGNLYSREHFQNCRGALTEQGVMVQWIPLHQVSIGGLKVIMATFADVFPHVSLWWGTLSGNLPIVALVGSSAPIEPGESSLRARMAPLSGDLREVLWDDPACFLGNFIARDAGFRAFAGDARLNTDDRPAIEYQTPKAETFEWDPATIAGKLDALARAMDTSDPRKSVTLSRRAHQAALEGLASAEAGGGPQALALIDSAVRLAPRCSELKAVRAEAEQDQRPRPASGRPER